MDQLFTSLFQRLKTFLESVIEKIIPYEQIAASQWKKATLPNYQRKVITNRRRRRIRQ